MLRKSPEIDEFSNLMRELSEYGQKNAEVIEERARLGEKKKKMQEEKHRISASIATNNDKIDNAYQKQISSAVTLAHQMQLDLEDLNSKLQQQKLEVYTTKEEESDENTKKINQAREELSNLQREIDKLTLALNETQREIQILKDKKEAEKQRARILPDNELSKIDKELKSIDEAIELLPDSAQSEERLVRRTTQLLKQISHRGLSLGPDVGAQVMDLFEQRPLLAYKWLESPIILEAIKDHPKLPAFYHKMLNNPEVEEKTAIVIISRLQPLCAPAISEKEIEQNQQEIAFQQNLRLAQALLAEIKAYIKVDAMEDAKEKNRFQKIKKGIANLGSGSLSADRRELLGELMHEFLPLNRRVTFDEFVNNYHNTYGRIVLLQHHGQICDLSKQLKTAQTEYEQAKKTLKDFIELKLPVLMKAIDAPTKNLSSKLIELPVITETTKEVDHRYDLLAKHHFFSSKKKQDTTAVELIKNLISALQGLESQLTGVEEQKKPKGVVQRTKTQ